MRAFISLVVFVTALAGQGRTLVSQQRPTSIESRPEAVALLRSIDFATSLTACAGSILNNRAVLSAARCFQSDGPERWRFRVGSTYWNSGGVVFPASEIVIHEDYDEWAMMTDIAVVRTSGNIVFSSSVQMGSFSGPNYVVPEGAQVATVGWGYNTMPVWHPTEYENLRQIQFTNFNVDVCRQFYSANGFWLRDTQTCTGFANVDANTVPRDKCFGEPGAPVYHQGVIVGVRSYGLACLANPEVPSINTRVSSFIQWIASVAEAS